MGKSQFHEGEGKLPSSGRAGSNLRGAKITFDKDSYSHASEHIHMVFEINLQNNNSLMCML